MTANKNLLRMKYARVIEAYAARTGCSLGEALDAFYRSKTYELMRDGVSDMHCMSDAYLVDELVDERLDAVSVPPLSVAEEGATYGKSRESAPPPSP